MIIVLSRIRTLNRMEFFYNDKVQNNRLELFGMEILKFVHFCVIKIPAGGEFAAHPFASCVGATRASIFSFWLLSYVKFTDFS